VAPKRLFVAPEFLRQGSVIGDIRRPTRVVVGIVGERPNPAVLALVTGALAQPRTPLLVMRAEEASLVKKRLERLPGPTTHARERGGWLAEDLGVDAGLVPRGDRA
jgi:hypothetical protein